MTAMISETRFTEIEAALRSAEDEVARNLGVKACSMVLFRLVGSSDKEAEFDFISNTISRIMQVQPAIPDSNQEASGARPVGELYSILTDSVERMTPKELYSFMAELRKEPFHQLPEESETLEVPDRLSA